MSTRWPLCVVNDLKAFAGTLASHVPHMPVLLVMAVLGLADLALIAFALNRFHRKTTS